MAERIGAALGVALFLFIAIVVDWGIQIKPVLEALGIL